MATSISVLINPIWFGRVPTFRIGLDNQLVEHTITEPQWFEFTCGITGTRQLTIEHYGKVKSDTDVVNNKDTAIIVEQIRLNELTSPRFVWAGVYQPEYPDYYVKEQLKQNKVLESKLSPHTYLGWNGVWTLDFTLPIYTWIHKIENLGWIYD